MLSSLMLYPVRVCASLVAMIAISVAGQSSFAQQPASGDVSPRLVLPALYAQNVLLKFVLGSYGKSNEQKIQAVRDAEETIMRFAFQKRQTMMASNAEDLERIKQTYFPGYDSLQDELYMRRNEAPPKFIAIVPGHPDVDQNLERLWRSQAARLGAIGNLNGVLNSPILDKTANQILFTILDNPASVRVGSALLPDRARLALAEMILREFREAMAQVNSTGRLIADSGAIQQTDPSMQRFFQLMLGEYFKSLSLESKLNIISQFIDNPDLKTPGEKFELMVMQSGPQFQKLFQVYARAQGFSPEMKNVFKRLESGARSAPWRLVEPIIRGQHVPFKWVQIRHEPFGVGTMAQVHRAKIRLTNGEIKNVVVRVMKPGIEERLEADNRVLRTIAPVIDADPILRQHNFPLITPFVNEIIDMGMRELYVPQTAAATKRAEVLYAHEVTLKDGSKIQFRVPKTYDTGTYSQIMVQEYIQGTGFDSFAAKNPELARLAVEELAKLWIREALLGSGFYHSDLHQGNIRIEREADGTVKVNLLDFGLTGEINRILQNRIIALSAILGSKRADLMASAMWELSVEAENTITRDQLESLLRRELDLQARSSIPPYDFGAWVAVAASAGIKFPPEFTSLNRGITLMTQLLRNQKSNLEIGSIVKSALVRKPLRLHQVVQSLDSIRYRDWFVVAMANARRAKARPAGMSCQLIFAGAR